MMGSPGKFGAALCALMALSGCGGGGSGGSGGGAPPVSLPSPAPAPAPAPSPTYLLATDFSGDRDFPGWGVRLVASYTAPPFGAPAGNLGTTRFSATTADETRAAGFLYTAATRTYTVRWFNDQRSFGPAVSELFQGFLPVDRVGTEFTRGAFRVDIARQEFTRYCGGFGWQINTGNGNAIFDSETRTHNGVFGSVTQASDLPSGGTALYRHNPVSAQNGLPFGYVVGLEEARLTVNWATGEISGTWTAPVNPSAPPGSAPLSLSVTGQVNLGSGRASGTMTGQGFAGTFTGAVFGPRAAEMAFAYQIGNGQGGYLTGLSGTVRNPG